MTAQSEETHELAIGTSPTLRVRNPIGGVHVHPGAEGQMRIAVTKTVRGIFLGGNGQRELDRASVEIVPEGDTVAITVHQESRAVTSKLVTVDLDIALPAAATLDLHVDAGTIEVEGISGQLATRVDAGNVTLRGVTFASGSEISVDAGKVSADGALVPGASLHVRIDAGSVRFRLPASTAVRLDAHVDAGSLSVHGFDVPVSGGIVSHEARGDTGPNASGVLRIRVDAGTLTIERGE